MKSELEEALAAWTSAVTAVERAVSAVCEGEHVDEATLQALRAAVDEARHRCELAAADSKSLNEAVSARPAGTL